LTQQPSFSAASLLVRYTTGSVSTPFSPHSYVRFRSESIVLVAF
jgi:hypothetical protein